MTKTPNFSDRFDPPPTGGLDCELEDLIRDSLERLLPSIKPELAEVFQRRELIGESREALAASLGISVDTVDDRLQAARDELRTLLERGALHHLDQPKRTKS